MTILVAEEHGRMNSGCLDVTSLGEGARVVVERRDQGAPRKGTKGF